MELRNRFSALADTPGESDHETTNKWDTTKKTYVEVATKVLGHKKKNHKESLTPGTWKNIQERKQFRIKMPSTKSPKKAPATGQRSLQRQRHGSEKSARNDKRSFVEGLTAEAECAAVRGELSTVHKIIKRLCGNYTNHCAPVKGKDGSSITTEREQADRWVEHFCEVLNHLQPDEPADLPPAPDDHNIDTRQPTEAEVKNLHQSYEKWKSPRHRLHSC